MYVQTILIGLPVDKKKNEMTNCHKKRNGYAKQLINGGVGHVHVVTYYLRYETIKSSVVL